MPLDDYDYSCLVTRLNYAELTGEDSIWENLCEWLCDEDRLGHLACKSNDSKVRITAPNGNTIWFKAFDQLKKKQKVKSESYDRIINDEASELHPQVLQFLFRSLRSTLDSPIPLGMLNLSNPGGPSTDYLCNEYVDGQYHYYPLDWRHNPFINAKVYSKTLDKLSYADQRYQKYGDWHYVPKAGDIFNRELIDNATKDLKWYRDFKRKANLLQIVRLWDIAASDKDTSDYTACSLVHRYDKGDVVTQQTSFRKRPGPLEEQMELIMSMDGPDVEQWIEHQPAAAGNIVDHHWSTYFSDYNVLFVPVFKNKVLRAGRLVPKLKNEELFFIEDKADPYLETFIKQGINFPNFKKKDPEDPEAVHDDRIDSVSLLYVRDGGNPYTESDQYYEYTKGHPDNKQNKESYLERRRNRIKGF